MAAELLPDVPPIEAGPIIIDPWVYASNEYEETHLTWHDFVVESMIREIPPNVARRAHRLIIGHLIKTLDLGILPPYEALEVDGEEVWGPYETDDYFIEHSTFLDSYDAVVTEAENDDRMTSVLGYMRKYIDEQLSFHTKHIPPDQLPDALYTEIYPSEHIEAGHLISYRDFGDAVYALRTSSAKTASVFDAVVAQLGNERAKKEIADLDWRGNPYDRRRVRNSLYIRTQALAEFVEQLSATPPKERDKAFNLLSLQLLRNILYEEEPTDSVDVPPDEDSLEDRV